MATTLEDPVSMAIFARVVEAKSFTTAASALSGSTSPVSKRVTALDERLGARLLQRTTRSPSLMPDGSNLSQRCLRMVHAADERAELAEARGAQPRGALRLTCPTVFADAFLSDVIASFGRNAPRGKSCRRRSARSPST